MIKFKQTCFILILLIILQCFSTVIGQAKSHKISFDKSYTFLHIAGEGKDSFFLPMPKEANDIYFYIVEPNVENFNLVIEDILFHEPSSQIVLSYEIIEN